MIRGEFLSYNITGARVVKLVDTADLKSAASLIAGVPVRFRFRAPINEYAFFSLAKTPISPVPLIVD